MMRRLLAATAAALLLAGAASPAQAQAADDKPPTLHSIEFSRTALTVSGLDTGLLMVSVHLSDPDGVAEHVSAGEGYTPLIRVGQFPVKLTLGTGTPQDGVWTGGVAVTSDWSGVLRPTKIDAEDEGGNRLDVDPATVLDDLPTFTVTSSGNPKLTMTFTPDPASPGQALTQRIVATDRASGRTLSGAPIVVTDDNLCIEGDFRAPTARTNAAGVWTRALPAGNYDEFIHCAWFTGENIPEQPATRIAPVNGEPNYRYLITATPASATAPAGTNVAVTGTVRPYASGKEVQLQRLYAANDWRTVSRGTADSSSKFRINATPPGTATYSYRVFAPAQEHRVAAYSPVFTIRGT